MVSNIEKPENSLRQFCSTHRQRQMQKNKITSQSTEWRTRKGGKGRLYELCNRYYVSFPFVQIGQLLTLAAKWHVPEFVDDTIPDTWSYGVSNGHLNESNVLGIWRAMRKTRIFTVWQLIDFDAMLI